jgi:hypothetical protein
MPDCNLLINPTSSSDPLGCDRGRETMLNKQASPDIFTLNIKAHTWPVQLTQSNADEERQSPVSIVDESSELGVPNS